MIFLSPTFRTVNHVRQQTGFILLPVVIAIVIIASVAFMLNNQSAINGHSLGGESQGQQAEYVAEAGFNHALWQTNNSSCSGYPNPLESSFGLHKYSASVSPTSGSPVAISVTGTLADGSTRSLQRDDIAIYQPPVVLVMQPDATEGKDTHIYQWRPTWNFGIDPNLVVAASVDSTEHSLLQFDLSAIPAGVTIISANLELRSNSNAWWSATVDVHRVTKGWVEGGGDGEEGIGGANWTESNTGIDWGAVGGDFDPTIIASAFTPGSIGVWASWDVAALVSDWVNGTAPNYGLIIRTTQLDKGAQFDSSDAAIATNRPKLTITYACECGVGNVGSTPLSASTDTYIAQGSNANLAITNYGDKSDLTVGNHTNEERSLLKFDLSGLPAQALISSASLTLNYEGSGTLTDGTINAYRVTTDWLEMQANWNESESGVAWNGGTFDPTVMADAIVTEAQVGTSIPFDITSLVQSWHDGSAANQGLLLAAQGGVGYGTGRFSSNNNASTTLRPKLTVNYTCPCGVVCSSPPPPPPPPLDGYYDEFNSAICNAAVDYIGSDGTLDWSSWAWSEIVDSGDSCSGAIKLKDDAGDNVLHFSGDGNGIMRQVDLSGFAGAVLSFDYRRSDFDDVNDYLTVGVSADGGTNWSEVGRIEGPATDTGYLSASYDISSYMASNTVIRFVTAGLGGNGPNADLVYLDSVRIVEVVAPPACNADFIPGSKISEFSTSAYGSAVQKDLDYLPEGVTFNGVAVPVGGAWLSVDATDDLLYLNDMSGALLSTLPGSSGMGGVAYVRSGTWAGHIAVSDFNNDDVRYYDMSGAMVASFSLAGLAVGTPSGAAFIGVTTSGIYDGHLAISDRAKSLIYILDQAGTLKTTLNMAVYGTGPTDVAHMPGSDKLLILDETRLAYIVDMNGAVTGQYDTSVFGTSGSVGLAINSLTCDHVIGDDGVDKVIALNVGGGGGPSPSGEVIFEEYTQASIASVATTMNINKPGGTAAGDLLIAVIVTDGEQKKEMSGSGAWTLIDHGKESKQVSMDVWWKLADASEPAQYTFGWEKSQEAYGWIMRFTGNDPVSPINVSSSAGGSSNSPTSPAVTTTVANTMILRIGGFDDDDITAGAPGLASHTAITMGDSGDGASTTSGGAGYMTQAVAGDSGTADFSLTATEEYRAVTIGIAPAP